jgi:D-alanyl-D-alanine carboxypeptidase
MMLSRMMVQTRFASSCCAYAIVLALLLLLSACGSDDSPADPAYATSARAQINQLLNAAPGVSVQSPNGDRLESFGTAVRCTTTPIPTDAQFGRRLSMRSRRS